MAVRIVTDSGADLPRQVAADLGISVVPITVRFGTEEMPAELSPAEFWARCARSSTPPQTAAPPPGRFAAAYQTEMADGAEAVVSLHMSARLSGTVGSAAQAARAAARPVSVVDTRSVSLGQGLLVCQAAQLAAQGAGPAAVIETVTRLRARLEVHACLDTLEFLRRGGRIGSARALVGSLLDVKPLVTLSTEGEVAASGRVRTRRRALATLHDRLAAAQPLDDVAVMHASAPDIDEFLSLVAPLAPDPLVAEVGPVVGTHIGPGAVGVAFVRSGG